MADETTAEAEGAQDETTAEAEAPVDSTLRALLVERAGYLRMGKPERVAAVDEQLRVRGYADATDINGTPLIASAPAPSPARGRRTTKG